MIKGLGLRSVALVTLLGVPLAACADGGDAALEPTGNVVEVEMISAPGQGEVFTPADLTVQRGDVVRFVLVSGVHNAAFHADRNPSGVDLPEATPYLQAPGQTHDLLIDLPPGEYEYVCDPHVPMGMIGKLTVTS
jgi:plastocyanin